MKKRIVKLSEIFAAKSGQSRHADENIESYLEIGKKQMEDAGLGVLLTGNSENLFALPIGSRANIEASGFLGEDVAPLLLIEDYTPLLTELGVPIVPCTGAPKKVPLPSGITATFLGETGESVESDTIIPDVNLSPLRISVSQPVSKLLLRQAGPMFEQLFLKNLIIALYNKLFSTIFGIAASTSVRPQGFGYKTTSGVNTKANASIATVQKIIALESELIEAGTLTGKLAYLTSGKGRQILRSTPVESGHPDFQLGYNNLLNGYPCIISNSVSRIAGGPDLTGELLIFGAWQDFIIAQFGALLVCVDPYTKARENKAIIEISGFFDAKGARGSKATSDNDETQADNYAYSFASMAIRSQYGNQG